MARPSLEPHLTHILRHPLDYEERTTDVVLHRPPRDTRDTEEETRILVNSESQNIADTFAQVYRNNWAAIDNASPYNDSHVDHLPVPAEAPPIDEEMDSIDSSVNLLDSSGDGITDSKRFKSKGHMVDIANVDDSWEEKWQKTRETYMFAEKYLQKYGPHPAVRPWSPRSSAPSSREENQGAAQEQEHVTIDEEQLRREKRKNYHLAPKRNRYANRRRF